jgi:MFS family permease
VLVAAGVSNIIVQAGLMGRLTRRFGERRLAIAALLFQAVGVAGMAFVPVFGMMYLFLGIFTGAGGPFRPASSALLANRVSEQEQGRLNGVSASLGSLMSIFGPLAAGAMFDAFTPGTPFWIGGAVLLAAAAGLSYTFSGTRFVWRSGSDR